MSTLDQGRWEWNEKELIKLYESMLMTIKNMEDVGMELIKKIRTH